MNIQWEEAIKIRENIKSPDLENPNIKGGEVFSVKDTKKVYIHVRIQGNQPIFDLVPIFSNNGKWFDGAKETNLTDDSIIELDVEGIEKMSVRFENMRGIVCADVYIIPCIE